MQNHVFPLALKNDDGELCVAEVDMFAKRLRQPDIAELNVCVIGVLGKFREGKSTILNIMDRFCRAKGTMEFSPSPDEWLYQKPNEKEIFPTSKETQGCTQGLWITSEPYIMTDGKGNKYAVFLLDTQGLFDTKNNAALDSGLFLLTSLICSFTVFNVMRSLGQDQMNLMATFAKLAGKIRGLLYKDKAKIFEDLVFLIRDASLGGAEYGWESGKSYLKTGFDDLRTSNKNVLTEIQKAYNGLYCFLMPRIAAEPDDRDFKMTKDFVLPKFRDHVAHYLDRMFSSQMMRPFQHKGKRRSCVEFADFIENITTLFNDGKIPKAEDMLQAMVKFEFQVAVDQALAYYRSEMKKATDVPLEYEKLRQHHDVYKKNCKMITTTEVAVLARDPIKAKPHIDQLDKKIEEEFLIIRESNDRRMDDQKAREEAARKEQLALQEAARVAQQSKELEEKFSKDLALQQERLEQMEATTEAERQEKARLLKELAEDRVKNEQEKHDLEAKLLEIQEKNTNITREQQAWRDRENSARGRRDQLLREATTKAGDLETVENELKDFRSGAPGFLNAIQSVLSFGYYDASREYAKRESSLLEKVHRLQSEISHARTSADEEAAIARMAAEEEAAAIKREQLLRAENAAKAKRDQLLEAARVKREQFLKAAQAKEDQLEAVERDLQSCREVKPSVWGVVGGYATLGYYNPYEDREQKEKVLLDRMERIKKDIQRLYDAANEKPDLH